MYDISTKKQTRIGGGTLIGYPVISGNRVIWNDMYNMPVTCLYDFAKKKWIDLPFDYVEEPAMYGNNILYTDYRNGNADIYMTQI